MRGGKSRTATDVSNARATVGSNYGSAVDHEWARNRLQSMLELMDRYLPVRYTGQGPAVLEELQQTWPTCRLILEELVPDAITGWTLGSRGYESLLSRACRMALGVLADQEEVERHLGTPAPRAALDLLHPWIWDAARTFWSPGGHRVAVQQAATALTAHTQQKTGRYDVADDALMAEVWGQSPGTEERPRLRLPGHRQDQTQASRQRGALSLAQGCYWALRNPAAHSVEDWPEHLAVEALCALSIVARLIDEADVEASQAASG